MTESAEDLKARLAEAEAKLKLWDGCLTQGLAAAGVAMYRRNFETGEMDYVSAGIESLTGYEPSEFTVELWESIAEFHELLGDCAGMEPLAATEQFRQGKIRRWQAKTRIRTKAGEMRWLLHSATALPGPDVKAVAGSIGLIQDITELKTLEQREDALQQQLQRAKRMESLGTLAGSVAHDLNNILVPIVAYPELIAREAPEDSRIRDYTSHIERAGHRASTVVSNLLSLARQELIEQAPLNLNQLVEHYANGEVFRLLVSKTRGITPRTDLAMMLPPALGDETAMHKVLINLANNAVDFMPNGGELTIRTSHEELDESPAEPDDIPAGEYVILEVSDTGCGFDTEDLDRIFEPFYTKKLLGRNASGLSLAVAYSLVREQGGYLSVQSELGRGSSFRVYLPLADGRHESKQALPQTDHYDGTETILVVDDDEAARTAACRFLEKYGYNVITADSGRQAIDILKSPPGPEPIALVLLDMIMEEDFDGLDTYKAILATVPQQRCLLVSGYAETERVREALDLGAGRMIRKPFTVAELCRAVRQELDASH